MKRIQSIIIVAALLMTSVIMNAQDATVRIHERGTGETIPAEIYGQFSEHLGSCIYGGIWVGKDSSVPNIEGYRKDVLDALKALKVPVLRWPGGCFADHYHWMDGIGPQEKRSKTSNFWGGVLEDNSFGTHEFLNLCEMLGIEPYISGNVGSGSVEEMANWLEYMTAPEGTTVANMRVANGRKEPWRVKYFGIGNEAWGCGGNMTPEYYSDMYRRYATYLRNKGGWMLKVGVGPVDYDYNWTEVLMKNAGSYLNALSLHYYTYGKGTSATNIGEKQYYDMLSKTLDIENVMKKHIEIMDRYDPAGKVNLIIDEWGTWFDVEPGTDINFLHQQSTMLDAMVAALNFDIFHKYTKRLKMCNIAQIVNVLQAMILTNETDMVLTPTYHVFEMYNVHQDAEYLATECDTPLAKGSFRGVPVPVIDATASRKDGKIHFDLVNTNLKSAKTVLVEFDDAKAVRKIDSARILTSKKVQDCNDFDNKNLVAPKAFSDYKLTKRGVEVTLPPCSIIAFEAE